MKPTAYDSFSPGDESICAQIVSVRGDVRSQSNIVELSANGVSALARPGPIVSFNLSTRLKEGGNPIAVFARNEQGLTAEKEISIVRNVREADKLRNRYKMMMNPFSDRFETQETARPGVRKSFFASSEHEYFQNHFFLNMTEKNRFQIKPGTGLEKAWANWKAKNELTSVMSENDLPPHALLVGKIYETINGTEVLTHLIDIRTREILDFPSAYTVLKGRPAMENLAERLAKIFHNRFPMADGEIREVKDKTLYTVFDRQIGLRMPVFFYRGEKEVFNPETGVSWGSDTKILESGIIVYHGQNQSDGFLHGAESDSPENGVAGIQDRIRTR